MKPANPNRVVTTTPVVVFRADNYCSLGIIRSLGRLGVRVHCIDSDPRALGLLSRYCTRGFLWDFKSNGDEELVRFLIKVAREIGGRPILIPTFDPRNLLVDRHRAQLSEWYRLPQPNVGALPELYSKQGMYEICLREDVPTPATAFPTSSAEAEAAGARLGFPLVIKGIDVDRLMWRTGRRMAIVHSPAELQRSYVEFDEPGVANLALQEFIPGGEENAWMINAYIDANCNCRFAVTGRKLRQFPVDGGVTTLGVTAPCPAMVDSIDRIVRAVGYRGIVDADYVHDHRDGKWKLVDVNPRPGANARLCVDANGIDVARALYLDLTGQGIPVLRPAWGRKWLVEDKDLFAVAQQRRAGALSIAGWLRSLCGVAELAHLAGDDLRPSLAFASGVVGAVLRSLARRVRRVSRVAGVPPAAKT